MMHRTVAGGGDVPLHVVETGNPSGRPILFLHGFSQTWLAWTHQLHSDLGKQHRLVALDLRGHGRSGQPLNAYGESRLWADDIHAVIRALALDRPVICGWSYGPLIFLDYVRYYGDDDIGGLQFIGGVSKLGSDEALAMLTPEFLSLIPGFFSDELEASVSSLRSLIRICVVNEPSEADTYLLLGGAMATPTHVRRALFSRMIDNDDLLSTIRKPVLLTHGTQDAVVKPDIVQVHAARMRHAQIDLVDNTGHAPFWEDPERFNSRLEAFVAEC